MAARCLSDGSRASQRFVAFWNRIVDVSTLRLWASARAGSMTAPYWRRVYQFIARTSRLLSSTSGMRGVRVVVFMTVRHGPSAGCDITGWAGTGTARGTRR